MKIKLVVSVVVCMSVFSAGAAVQSGEAMELSASVWAAFMRGNMVVNGQKAEVHRDTWDYYKDLSVGGSLELGLRNQSMVVLGAVDYFDGMSSDITVGSQAGTLETSEMVGVLAVGYPFSPVGGNTTFDALVGLQWQQVENDLKMTGGGKQSAKTDVLDPVLMVRIKTQLGNKLFIGIPLSIGVSYLGESDMIYDAGLQLQYQLTDTFDIRAGYRISSFDYQEDANQKWDYYVQGYTLGLGLTF